MPRQSWDDYFLAHAELTATRSTCIRRHVGCVMVRDHHIVACGYNGAPRTAPTSAAPGLACRLAKDSTYAVPSMRRPTPSARPPCTASASRARPATSRFAPAPTACACSSRPAWSGWSGEGTIQTRRLFKWRKRADMRVGTVTSDAYADAVCAIMWGDGWDGARLIRWLPRHMAVKGDRIVDTVRHIEHVLTPGCIVILKKNGSVEVV